jgi:hypothetical protein
MFKIQNGFIKKHCAVLICSLCFVLVLLFLFLINRSVLGIDNFVESATAEAFNLPTFKKWSFEESSNWYKVKGIGSSYQIPFKDLGMTMPSSVMSIAFLITIMGVSGTWREVFRINDATSRDCCEKGDRIPAFFIWNDNTTKFHIRFSSDGAGNDGINAPTIIPMGIPILATLVFNGNNFKFYVNNYLSYTGDFNNIYKRTDKSILYIGENFPDYGADGNVLIKNFTIYDGALTDADVSNMYNKLEQASAGPAGPAGPMGPAGAAGSPGPAGPSGAVGSIGQVGPAGVDGPMGPMGPMGPVGSIGPAGPIGEKGEKGDKGDAGERGEQGLRGEDGTSVSASSTGLLEWYGDK